MRINIVAAANRGQTPCANRVVEVEKDTNGIYLSFPQATGVVDVPSAIAIGQGMLETAGFAAPASSDSIPAGWELTSHEGGFVLTDEDGVVRGNFRPSTVLVSV